jgi:hypothetical protein
VKQVKNAFMSILAIVALLIAVVAFAHPGGGRYANTPEQQKFIDVTKDLRKQMHDTKFELRELYRTPESDQKKITELEKKMDDLRAQIREKADDQGISRGYGNCDGPGGFGYGKGRGYNRSGNGDCGNCWKDGYGGHGPGYGRMMW